MNSLNENSPKAKQKRTLLILLMLTILLLALLVGVLAAFLWSKGLIFQASSQEKTTTVAEEGKAETTGTGEDTWSGNGITVSIQTGIDQALTEKVQEANKNAYILNSFYQYAEGYGWEDLYVVLIRANYFNYSQHSTECGIFRIKGVQNPFLLVGYQDEGGATSYVLYLLDGENLYKLMTTAGRISYNTVAEAFTVEGDNNLYFFRLDVLVRCPNFLGSSFELPVTMTKLSSCIDDMTTEKIGSFVQDFREVNLNE